MKPRDVMVATHGHCFDGTSSAALFTHLLRSIEPSRASSFRYRSCGYGPGMQQIPEGWLDGEVSAILDFRYTKSARLTWYFDHHITGFGTPEERDQALAGARGGPGDRPQVHYDPASGSCTKLIAEVSRDRFGVDMSAHAELIAWADLIDTAGFASAEAATRRDEPVLQLAAVIEHHADGPFLNQYVPRLMEEGVIELAKDEAIQGLWRPIAASRETFTRRVEKAAQRIGPVVWVDLTDAPIDISAKFMTYALYPDAMYSVQLARVKQHYKLSVGYNPWSPSPRRHDIASICRRYEGGGHPAVGACAFPLDGLDRARAAAKAIVEELGR
ncbi:MAG: hypothetical protein U0359_18260 [Byssovorax sp.]